MVTCCPSGHSRKDKSLLGTARRYSSPPGPWRLSQFLPQSPWSALSTPNPKRVCCKGEPSQLASALFLVPPTTCHQPFSKCSLSHTSPLRAPPATPPALALAQAPLTLPGCVCFLLSLVCSQCTSSLLGKQICLWFQRPSVLHCMASKAKAPHLAFGFFPTTYFQLTPLASSSIPPPHSHSTVTLVKS